MNLQGLDLTDNRVQMGVVGNIWSGIVMGPDANVTLRFAELEKADIHITGGSKPVKMIDLNNVVMNGANTAFVYLDPTQSGQDTVSVKLDSIIVKRAPPSATTPPYGVYVAGDSTLNNVQINYSEIRPGTQASYGVYLENLVADRHGVESFIHDTELSAGSSAEGLRVVGAPLKITDTYALSCNKGFVFTGGASADLSSGDYVVRDCGVGIEVSDSATVEVSDIEFDDSDYGLITDSSGNVNVTGLVMGGGIIGLDFQGTGVDTVRDCVITSFTSSGIKIASGATVNLGTSSDPGNNSVHSASASYYVYSKLGPTVSAEKNWWGTSSPSSSYFTANIDYDPWLVTAPSYGMSIRAVQRQLLVAKESPFFGSTSFSVYLEDETDVSVSVFDVSGRKVRSLMVAEKLPQGETYVAWYGRSDRGVMLPAGVYFVRAVSADARLSQVVKIIRLGR